MRTLLFVAAMGIVAYWLDANWYHGQYYLHASQMLRDVYLHFTAAG